MAVARSLDLGDALGVEVAAPPEVSLPFGLTTIASRKAQKDEGQRSL
jgi:hypothetical protein